MKSPHSIFENVCHKVQKATQNAIIILINELHINICYNITIVNIKNP